MILEYQAAFSDPSFPSGPNPMDLSRTVILLFCPSPSCWCCECHQGQCNLRLPVTFMSPRSPSFLVSMRCSTECLTVGSSGTWLRNLSVPSWSTLDASPRVCCPSCRCQSGLSPPGRPMNVRLLLPVCRGPHPLDFLARCPAADAPSLQCHPYWSAP